MWVLAVTLGSGNLFHFPLPPGLSTVGRSEANVIRLPDDTVSSTHAELVEIGPGRYRLRDLGSTNGTYVNGLAVSEAEISAPCSLAFGSLRCQLTLSSAPGDPRLSVESMDKQQTIGGLTKENDELKLARAELLETLERARTASASQLETLARQGEQAARDAESESVSIKQALAEATTKLAVQEQEHKRELAAALKVERKERREKLGSDHAAQVAKLEAEGETHRVRAEELLSQIAKAREEIGQMAAVAEQSKNMFAEKDQALRDAESETGSLKKDLHDLNMRLVSQEEDFKQKLGAADARQEEELETLARQGEQAARDAESESASIKQALEEVRTKLAFQEREHKRELIAAVEVERKERERLTCDHRVQLTKLETDGESHRLRAQELLSQIAKTREESAQMAQIAEDCKKTANEKDQALREVESETGLLKKALHDLSIRLASQEQDFKRKLDSAETRQQEERDQLSRGQAAQLAELRALHEIQQRQTQELHDQVEALKKDHQRAIERLKSTHRANLVAIRNGIQKRLAELSDHYRKNITGKDCDLAVPQPHYRHASPQANHADLPTLNHSAASTQTNLDRILNALPRLLRSPSAATVAGYLFTFVLGVVLSAGAFKRDVHQPRGLGVRTGKSDATETIAIVARSTSAPEPAAPNLSSVNAERVEAKREEDRAVSSETAATGLQLPPAAAGSRPIPQLPSWLAGYQLATGLLAQSAGANPLVLLGSSWSAADEPPETSTAFKNASAFSAQNTFESPRISLESEGSSGSVENPGADPQRSDTGVSNTTDEDTIGNSAPPSSPAVLTPTRAQPSQSANTSEAALESDPLWTITLSTNKLTTGSIGADGNEGYTKSDLAFAGAQGRPLFGFDMNEVEPGLKAFPGIADKSAIDLPGLAFFSLPSADHQLREGRETMTGNIFGRSAVPASAPLTVLILGDSMSLCGFGKRLDDKIRALPQVKSAFTYMASGTNPLSWLKEKPYANARTRSGFWSIETVQGKSDPKVFRDTYGMRRGSTPKSHPVPKLEDLLSTNRPDILVVQNGTNLFDLFRDGRTVQPKRQGPLLKHYIEPFMATVLGPASPVRKIYWVSSPTSGRVSKEIQDFVFDQLCMLAGGAISVIDSRQLISYPYHNTAPDREHFIGRDMDQWADKVYEIIERDISSQSLAASKPFNEFPPGSTTDQSSSINGKSRENDLYVSATLTFKSEPLKVKELFPYQDSLVAYVYTVRQVLEGEYDEKNILVMHPAHIGLKNQSLKHYQIGRSYNLRLRELETTQWSTVKSKDDSGELDLTPYILAEDDLRIQGHGRGAAIDVH